ncbi:MAG: hypothetical protein LBK68_03100 [Candidatus Margulisbacteria bacterium]|jgi:hypothetical protein|nr:hypothetical protein [Candidatus Margulisiibacteriota bacterium]
MTEQIIKPNRAQRRAEQHKKRLSGWETQPKQFDHYIAPPADWISNNKKRRENHGK